MLRCVVARGQSTALLRALMHMLLNCIRFFGFNGTKLFKFFVWFSVIVDVLLIYVSHAVFC